MREGVNGLHGTASDGNQTPSLLVLMLGKRILFWSFWTLGLLFWCWALASLPSSSST